MNDSVSKLVDSWWHWHTCMRPTVLW